MKIKPKFIAIGLLIGALLSYGVFAFGQSAGFWYPSAGYLRPTVSTYGLQIPALANCNTIDTNASGIMSCGVDATGGGGSGTSYWSTTTNALAIYPVDTTDVVIVGGSATTTSGYKFEVIGSSLFDNIRSLGATSTQSYTTVFGLNSEYFTDLTGTGLQNTAGVLTLNNTGNWLGTLGGYYQNSFLHTTYASSTYVARGTWTSIDNYPTGCTNQFVRAIDDTLTCATVDISSDTNLVATLPVVVAGDRIVFRIGAGLGLSSTSSLYIAPNAITDAMVVDTITAAKTGDWLGTLGGYYQNSFLHTTYASSTYVARGTWTSIDSYPAACGAGQYVSAVGDTLTCGTPTGGTGGSNWQFLTVSAITPTSTVGFIINASSTFTGNLRMKSATSTNFAISNLTSCDTIDTDANGNLECGTDAGTAYTFAQPLVNAATLIKLNIGAYMKLTSTSSLTIEYTETDPQVDSVSYSGYLCEANGTAATCDITYIDDSVLLGGGAGWAASAVPDCDTATSQLTYDTTTNAFSCGTDLNTTYTVSSPLTLTGTVFGLKYGSGLGLSSTSSLYIAPDAITDAMVVDTITASKIGNWLGTLGGYYQNSFLHTTYASSTYVARGTWTSIDSYPTGCTNQFVRTIGDTLTCATVDVSSDTNLTAKSPLTISADQMQINYGTGLYLTSTSSLAVSDLYILNTGDIGTGVYDFGGATSFEISNGASPTVDAEGEIAIDTSGRGNIVYYASSSVHTLSDERFMRPVMSTSTLRTYGSYSTTGTTTIQAVGLRRPWTVKELYCKITSGTGTAIFKFGDGTNYSTSLVCDTSGVSLIPASNNTFTAREDFYTVIGTGSATVDAISLEVVYTIDRE